MYLKSKSKIIRYPYESSQVPRYSIHLKTDAGVTIVVEIPVDRICTISGAANKVYPINKTQIEADIHNVAVSYINLYKSLGISVLDWEIKTDDPK